MRNTITLNGQDSSDIEGLLIQSLPPISKPLMRTQIEEIDGRDGDIVTNLGFSAYKKEITIGLYGDFDIDAIIAYFNSQGTVIFSNEPDKYYNYQIIDQIDFERLIRFRTATVTMHCQPFKYSATEGADILSASDNFATLNQTLNTDSSYYTYTSNVQADVTATRNGTANNSKFFAVFTIPVVQGITYHFGGNVSSKVTMYAYTDTLRGTSAGIAGKPLTSNFSYTATFTGTMVLGFYSGSTTEVFIRNFFVTDESGATVSGEGNDFVLEGTSEAPFTQFNLKGDTAQQTYSGKNKFNTRGTIASVSAGYEVTDTTVKVTQQSDAQHNATVGIKIPNSSALLGKTITLSCNAQSYNGATGGRLILWDSGTTTSYITLNSPDADGNMSGSVTLPNSFPSGSTDFVLFLYTNKSNSGGNTGSYTIFSDVQIEEGSKTPYEQYVGGVDSPNPDYPQNVQVVTGEQTITITDDDQQSQEYTVNLGSIELCKIGGYQDYLFKYGDDWYVHKEIRTHTTLTTEISLYSDNYSNIRYVVIPKPADSVYYGNYGNGSSMFFTAATWSTETSNWDDANKIGKIFSGASANNFWIGFPKSVTLADAQAKIGGANCCYRLATPTDTKITDNSLIAQLDEILAEAHAYDGRTHITATAADTNLPHIIAAAVGSSIDGTVTNSGNTTARPKLTLFGSGTIGIYLNGVQIFQVALGTQGHITIDTNAMEAYQDTTDNLMNRLVTGDYNNFVLNTGDNQLSFSGTVSMCVVENYSRWL